MQKLSLHNKTIKKTDKRASKQTDRRADKQISEQIDAQISAQSSRSAISREKKHKNKRVPSDAFFWITENQACVFSFLIQQESRITRLSDIAEETGVPYGTVRGVMKTLVRENCITKPTRYRRGAYHGIAYNVEESLSKRFVNSQHYRQFERQNDEQTVRKTDVLYSSSSSLIKTTTNPQKALDTWPELKYWRKKGLRAKQIVQWANIAECKIEIMLQYLCYCRYEMEVLGIEASKPIQNVFNWFYRVIEKSGFYPKPDGYMSHQELKAQAEQQVLDDKNRATETAEKVYRERIEAERKKTFYEMMSEPDCDLYRACLDKLMPSQRRDTTSKRFETAMWNRFNSIMSEDVE